MLLDVQNVKKVYGKFGSKTEALKDVSFSIEQNEYVAIMGESGSGKSTLLNILATFDSPTQGLVKLDGKDLNSVPSSEVARFRRERLGFVFQDFSVLDTLNNKDNILLPLVLSNVSVGEMERRLAEITRLIGIEDILDKFPYQISGGQRQRVAIARAIINRPQLILADEPTGALDSKTSEQILGLFNELNHAGNTILMVTHSVQAAATAKRVLFIKDGVVYHEVYRGDQTNRLFQERIADSLSVLNNRGEK